MRSLFLLRHGKSNWKSDTPDDASRELSARGRRDAAAVGRVLAATGHPPDLAFTSSTRRARDTLALAMASGGWSCDTNEKPEIEGDGEALMRVLREAGTATENLLIVGHEPGSSQLVTTLTGGGQIEMPTAALVRLELEVENWADVIAGCGRLMWLVTPRLIRRITAARLAGDDVQPSSA